ncbi:MAG: O-antigen ligase family protein [Pyrinomonadaceae bacterium]
MSTTSEKDYRKLSRKGGKSKPASETADAGLRPRKSVRTVGDSDATNLRNYTRGAADGSVSLNPKLESDEFSFKPKNKGVEQPKTPEPVALETPELSFSQALKAEKAAKREQKDFEILTKDNWIARNGHTFTFALLFLFTVIVLYRPYELVPGLGFLSKSAFFVAAATLAIFIPTQFSTEGNLTFLATEVKLVILFAAIALFTIPIAKSPGTAWAEFNDIFIKAVLMFIVMVNVVRTKKRLMTMLWLSMGIGLILSFIALKMYVSGDLGVEGYRVAVEVGGMFGNPNDLALHLLTMAPIALCLGFTTQSISRRLAMFAVSGIMLVALTVTYSRGAFLGLIVVAGFLVWKLGKQNRVKVLVVAALCAIVFILIAPGNYGQRLLSIVIPSLDPVGSRDQRKELLIKSIIVSLRNPWGIGIGNFPIVGVQNLVTHNAYTQVSSELGVLGLLTYLGFLVSPFKKLLAIERVSSNPKADEWTYFMSIGLQASLLGYMVSSFFISVAYGWFIYYLVAYIVAFRRIAIINEPNMYGERV